MALLDEVSDLKARWHGPKAERKVFDRMTEMKTSSFARGIVADLFGHVAPGNRAGAMVH